MQHVRTLFFVPLFLLACGDGSIDSELDLASSDTSGAADDAATVGEDPELQEVATLGELTETSEGLRAAGGGARVGTKWLFAFGKAAPDDAPGQKTKMREAVTSVRQAYTALSAEGFSVRESTDDAVVNRNWLITQLDFFRGLTTNDTFVFYAHTHGGTSGLPLFGMSWADLAQRLLAIPAKNVVVHMMACHSGKLIDAFNAVSTEWANRAREGRNLIVLSAVSGDELSGQSPEPGIGNSFTYAVAAATRPVGRRSTTNPFDGADGYNPSPSSWDGRTRFSGKVSFGELGFYVRDITMWAADHDAYYASQPFKHPQETGSYRPDAVFIVRPYY